MDTIPFTKMNGSGNDFIIINNLKSHISESKLSNLIKKICCRRMSIGADGLISIEKSKTSDFKWTFYNSDGIPAEMCGNGARCIAKYAYINGISGNKILFNTKIGKIHAKINNNSVKISIPQPDNIKILQKIKLNKHNIILNSIKIGVPHVVIFVNNIKNISVTNIGRKISNNKSFKPERTNVNFVEILPNHKINIRTFEKGVESETLSCGTGNVASALICAIHYCMTSPIILTNKSGSKLKVYFTKKNNKFENIFLEGSTRIIYTGFLWKEGLKYF